MIKHLSPNDARPLTMMQKINELVEQSNRQDAAIEQMAITLVTGNTLSFNAIDQENIFKILRGESNTENANLGEGKDG